MNDNWESLILAATFNTSKVLHYFKRIREQLIGEGKTSRYLAYAVGEIILITIGLFIAIQLNNFRDNRQAAEIEQKMLREVQHTLKRDIGMLKRMQGRLQLADSSLNRIMEVLNRPGDFPDSLLEAQKFAMMGIGFQYNGGAYEAIKSRGLDLISDDSVRVALVNLYDYSLPRSAKFIESMDNRMEQKATDLMMGIFQMQVRHLPNGATVPEMAQQVENPLQDAGYIEGVFYRKGLLSHHNQRLEESLGHIERVASLLDRKLGPLPD